VLASIDPISRHLKRRSGYRPYSKPTLRHEGTGVEFV
jgi:hypothetical protein